MKKRVLSLILVLSMLATLTVTFPITAKTSTSGTCGDNLTWTLDVDEANFDFEDEYTLTISGTGAMYDFYDKSPWYSLRYYICTVIIEYGVTSIGDDAFYNCRNLTSVTIPSSVTSIGDDAFSNCENLANITIPINVKSIGDYAFADCNSITSITIPNSVTSIGERPFADCNILNDINVSSSNNNYSSKDGVLFNKDKSTLICCPEGKKVHTPYRAVLKALGHTHSPIVPALRVLRYQAALNQLAMMRLNVAQA